MSPQILCAQSSFTAKTALLLVLPLQTFLVTIPAVIITSAAASVEWVG